MAWDQNRLKILLMGATQGVGEALAERLSLESERWRVDALSRRPPTHVESRIHWHQLDLDHECLSIDATVWISAGPLSHVYEQLAQMDPSNHPRVIWALSSASPDFKKDSSDKRERSRMAQLQATEAALLELAEVHGIGCQIIKTTLLYGRQDQNINRLAALIRALPAIPIIGQGLRAPVHVDDVAAWIYQLLQQWQAGGLIQSGQWRIQGGEILTYPQMLTRIAQARGLSLRLWPMPLTLVRTALALAHALGQLRDIEAPMLGRQAVDLIVDDTPARESLGWRARSFEP